MGKGSGAFERLLDKATSQLLLETDWESILQICDLIRQGDAQAKYAIGAIKKKLNDKNPHVVLYTLEVLESVVKNCGQTVHDEVANKQTMEELKELFKKQVESNVRTKILQLIQAWAQAFRNEPKYKVVQDTYQIMKVEGNVFPEFKESDAMFLSERAPDWVDAEECHRCRVQFGVVTRKHHCRACGQIFCGKCSSKSSTIPKFGIEKEVRVCEPCFEQLNKKEDLDTSNMKSEVKSTASAPVDLPPEYLTSPLSQQSQVSSSPVEFTMFVVSFCTNSSAPTAEELDPELARYLNRNYWEKKQEEVRKSPTPSAPVSVVESVTQPVETQTTPVAVVEQQYQNGESEENHDQFLKALQNSVVTFVNRMKSNHMRGRSITNDTAVLSLFQSINNMHPQLLELLNQLDEKRLYYEGLQDKLAQIRDARGALNALREEHCEKLRRAAEEAERQRQIQLAQKLEIMRQKKQEYLEMQRQLAIQRLQEQEKERQMRLEQQKQTIQMRAQMPAFPLPYAQLQSMPPASGVMYQPTGPTSFPGTFSPAGSVEGSPMHSVYMNQTAQPGTGPYSSIPVSGADPSMVNPYMYQAAAPTSQTTQQGQGVPTTNAGYSNYQPTPTQNYQNVVSQAPSGTIPQAPQSGGLGYMGSQSVPMGYQTYNMQNMMSTLPAQDPAMSNLPPQQSYLPAQQPMYQQMAPPGGAAPQQQQQQAGSEAQLISFD
ncbi:hepatocyte growth factor-regulated tyrosine kinase substrate [Rhincodon typus]|uniref:hepatocyte growth factor-regulated tyrosine kinase substrate n=1 Tax=Rhincodon typus TaxID=259920 RepID=UPI00202EE253|nr:hepatocyte growth factor-regulated tyrosine kinase substrate [Rhincodon typus]